MTTVAPGAALDVPPRSRAYFPELDVLRGAAIVFVVYLHAYFSAWGVTPRREVVAMHVIHLFAHAAVPVFLFVSGFLLAGEPPAPFRQFARRKGVALGVPLIVWMTAALAYRAWDENGLSWPLMRSFLLFDVSGQYYYLFVLAVFLFAGFFVRGWSARQLGGLAAIAFVVNLATVLYYQSSDLSGTFATLAYRNPLSWVFFFAAGLLVARSRGTLELPHWLLAGGILTMAVILAVYLIQGEVFDYYPVSYFGLTTFLFSCLSVVVYPSLVHSLVTTRWGTVAASPLRWLSRYAFAIYLAHEPFFVGYVTNRYVSGSALNDDYFKLMGALFAVGFATSLAFVVVVDHIAPRWLTQLVGIERHRRT